MTDTPDIRNTVSGAVHGDVVQAGVVHGDVRQVRQSAQAAKGSTVLQAGRDQYVVGLIDGSRLAVRSSYLQQVRRIAPDVLRDRDRELAWLTTFCTRQEGPAYVWCRADAWAGKSAMLSWFVLHPPVGVRIVSFFVTARFAGQSDRVAFTDVVLEQLAELLAQPMPAYLTDATRDAHLLDMLAEAATVCARRGERLVLVVDGLDEDRRLTVGPDAHSIAALLPPCPVAGMRVIVSGRPNPPIPADVPVSHPLRDPAVVYPVNRSRHATVIQADTQRELKRLLSGTQVEQDLLGLVAAAGGGLSGPDLAELTGTSVWQVEENLRAVAGRTFVTRTSSRRVDTAHEVYVLGHEELQASAVACLGVRRLDTYRRRLHRWAEGCRRQGWPDRTPDYLLRGYFRLLQDTGDLTRMIALATDPARHAHLLKVTGGDAVALAEMTAGQQAVLDAKEIDLSAMGRLAMHRAHLAARNTDLPVRLPALWAALGHRDHAEALVDSITSPARQARALAAWARAAATAGQIEDARELLNRADTLLSVTIQPFEQRVTFRSVALANVACGDIERAARTMFRIERDWHVIACEEYPGGDAMVALVRALPGPGDTDQVLDVACQIDDLSRRGDGLDGLARAVAATGQIDEAIAIAQHIPDDFHRSLALDILDCVAANDGDVDELEALAVSMFDQSFESQRALPVMVAALAADDAQPDPTSSPVAGLTQFLGNGPALCALAMAVAAGGDLDRAHRIMDRLDDADLSWAPSVVAVVEAMAAFGDIEGAEARIREMDDPPFQADAWAAAARARAVAGDLDYALTAVQSIAALSLRHKTVHDIVHILIAAGDLAQAETLINSIGDASWQARAVTGLAHALLAAGQRDRATALAGHAESLARSGADFLQTQQTALLATVNAAVAMGDDAHARELVDLMESGTTRPGDPATLSRALCAAAQAASAIGDRERARGLLYRIDIEALAQDTDASDAGHPHVIEATAAIGDFDHAEVLARSMWGDYGSAWQLITVAHAAAKARDGDRARRVIREAVRLARTVWSSLPGTLVAATMETIGTVDDFDYATALAGEIKGPNIRRQALSALARALAAGEDTSHARTVLQSIPDPVIAEPARPRRPVDEAVDPEPAAVAMIRALTELAKTASDAPQLIARAKRLMTLVAEPNNRATAFTALAECTPQRAHLLLAQAFQTGHDWSIPIATLVRIDPSAIPAIVDEAIRLASYPTRPA